jgi:hypothetical protein
MTTPREYDLDPSTVAVVLRSDAAGKVGEPLAELTVQLQRCALRADPPAPGWNLAALSFTAPGVDITLVGLTPEVLAYLGGFLDGYADRMAAEKGGSR